MAGDQSWLRLVVGDLGAALVRRHRPSHEGGGELGHGQCADGEFAGELLGVDVILTMTTEVEMRPCGGRGASATTGDVLAGDPVEICSELVELHPRSTPERGDCRLGADKSMPAQRGQLADRDSVPGHDERLALVKLAHDFAAVVAQLPLGDLFGHASA